MKHLFFLFSLAICVHASFWTNPAKAITSPLTKPFRKEVDHAVNSIQKIMDPTTDLMKSLSHDLVDKGVKLNIDFTSQTLQEFGNSLIKVGTQIENTRVEIGSSIRKTGEELRSASEHFGLSSSLVAYQSLLQLDSILNNSIDRVGNILKAILLYVFITVVPTLALLTNRTFAQFMNFFGPFCGLIFGSLFLCFFFFPLADDEVWIICISAFLISSTWVFCTKSFLRYIYGIIIVLTVFYYFIDLESSMGSDRQEITENKLRELELKFHQFTEATNRKLEEFELSEIGTIHIFAYEPVPKEYLLCEGQTLHRSDYPELYSTLRNIHGGSGDLFNLPDLRRKVVVGSGGDSSSNLGNKIGNTGGEETVTLTLEQMPSHHHIYYWGEYHTFTHFHPNGFHAINKPGLTGNTDNDNVWPYTSDEGGNKPHNNMQPSIVLAYAIKAKKYEDYKILI